MARVTEVALLIPQGSTYIHEFTYVEEDEVTPIDITGFTARCQIRRTIKNTTIELECTTENSKIVITDETNGVFELRIPSTDTEAFSFTRAVYDIEMIAPDLSVSRVVQGKVKVDPEVTR